jgi:hypothetical protein
VINRRYKKLDGMHSGHSYVVTGPASEMDVPMRWNLQCEKEKDDRLSVSEDELADSKRWQPLD